MRKRASLAKNDWFNFITVGEKRITADKITVSIKKEEPKRTNKI